MACQPVEAFAQIAGSPQNMRPALSSAKPSMGVPAIVSINAWLHLPREEISWVLTLTAPESARLMAESLSQTCVAFHWRSCMAGLMIYLSI